jgi:glycosyltransferase involved in cell wall biosynthesis
MINKTKIYIFHPYPGIGGADVFLERLIKGIDPYKYDIEFISLTECLFKKKIKNNVKFTKIVSIKTLYSFFKIIKIINSDNSYFKKIFISNQYFANVLSLLFLRRIKNLRIILLEINHINELIYSKNFLVFFKKRIIKFLVKLLYKKADIIIGNSFELSKDLSKFINKKVFTIYNPCFFGLRKKRLKKNTRKVILNIGRFVDQKDQLTLLKGFDYAKTKNNFKLFIVGYGDNYLKLQNFVKENKLHNVKIFNNVKNLNKFYKLGDLFILSSLYEGFPTVLVEAASYRIPIISSNCKSGVREILLNNKAGSLFDVGDYQSLGRLIDDFYFKSKKFYRKEKYCSENLERFSYKKNINLFNAVLKSLN